MRIIEICQEEYSQNTIDNNYSLHYNNCLFRGLYMKALKLGIIGAGFVGTAVDNGFDVDVDTTIVDPKRNKKTIKDILDTALCFVCVPTPPTPDGNVDSTILDSVLAELAEHKYKGIVAIKSTITPYYLLKFKKNYDLKLVYNPEFLTEANANQDFINSKMLVLGGKWRDCEFVEKCYAKHSSVKLTPAFKTDLITASLVKYTVNSFLATKVAFFNELYDLFQESNAHSSWEHFTQILSADPRMGTSHMQVPGPDGSFGFGGHCFPKDTEALLYYAKQSNKKLNILTTAVDDNAKKRKKKI